MYNNNLICYEESGIQKWAMIEEKDRNVFLMNLLTNNKVNNHSIFIIPTSGFVTGVWLWSKTHKSSRVDFYNFFDDYGIEYVKPESNSVEGEQIIHEVNEKRSTNDSTKYGWISPEGKYFHCGYQGHSGLASRICFGTYETDDAEKCLEEHGWCKVYKSLFEDKYSVSVGLNHTITDKQMQTLIELKLDNANGLQDMLERTAE